MLSDRDCFSWYFSRRQLIFDIVLSLYSVLVLYFLFKTGQYWYPYIHRVKTCVVLCRHARKHLSACEPEQLGEVQHCMALLALPSSTTLNPYRELLERTRWDKLVEQFRQENYRLFQLASQSVFTVALQAGLSALKTPYPFQTNYKHFIQGNPPSTYSLSEENWSLGQNNNQLCSNASTRNPQVLQD